jgi:hypothetical protein
VNGIHWRDAGSFEFAESTPTRMRLQGIGGCGHTLLGADYTKPPQPSQRGASQVDTTEESRKSNRIFYIMDFIIYLYTVYIIKPVYILSISITTAILALE